MYVNVECGSWYAAQLQRTGPLDYLQISHPVRTASHDPHTHTTRIIDFPHKMFTFSTHE